MIEIREIHSDEGAAARQIMLDVCHEIWGDTEEQTLQFDPLLDYISLPHSYRLVDGIFLVVVDEGKVIGSGALRRYRGKIAEIKRLWLLKPYRGRGLGKLLMQRLIDFAVNQGFERIWLELGTPDLQPEAVKLYTNLGFHPIPVYAHSECELALEKFIENG